MEGVSLSLSLFQYVCVCCALHKPVFKTNELLTVFMDVEIW